MAAGDGGADPDVITIRLQTAPVAVLPETQVRAPGVAFQQPHLLSSTPGWRLGPRGAGQGRVVRLPEATAVTAAGPDDKPAVEQHQVGPPGSRAQRLADVDVVQVDQVDGWPLVGLQAH